MPCAQSKGACVPSRRKCRTLRLAQCRAEDTVDERVRAPAPMFFRQFHRRVACGRRRHAIHTENLVESQTQELANGGLRLSDIGDVAPDHVVDRCACLDRAVDELRQKAAVALRQLHLAQRFHKGYIGIRIRSVYPLEHLHCKLPHTIDFFLTIPLHYAPFLAFPDSGSMISSSCRRTSFISTLVL